MIMDLLLFMWIVSFPYHCHHFYPSGAFEFTTVFSGVRVTRSLVLYVCFVDRCLPVCTFPFGHCVVCSSSIYGFWLPFWYLQTLLTGRDGIYEYDGGCLIRNRNCLPLATTWVHSLVFCAVRVAHLFRFFCACAYKRCSVCPYPELCVGKLISY